MHELRCGVLVIGGLLAVYVVCIILFSGELASTRPPQPRQSSPSPPMVSSVDGRVAVGNADVLSLNASTNDDELLKVLTNMETCLKTTGMLEYFQKKGLLGNVSESTEVYLKTIRSFVPSEFLTSFPNHCWKMDMKLQVSGLSQKISGQYGSRTFSVHGDPSKRNLLNQNVVRKGRYVSSKTTLHMACIPEVFLAGFPKCGTRYLYDQLLSHPLIIAPKYKEPHWWVNNEYFHCSKSKREMYFLGYLFNYQDLVQQLLWHKGKPNLLTVDSSPSKMFSWPNENYSVNYCLLPAVLPEILPRAKYIVVMRNPTDFLYSAFWFSCTHRGGDVPKDVQPKGPDIFHERVLSKIISFKSCIKHFPLAKCVIDASPNIFSSELHCGRSRIEMALYYVHVHKWLSVVPRSKFLFLTLEELSADTNGIMTRVWQFLGLPHVTLHPTTKSKNQQKTVDYRHDPRLAMREDTRELLEDFFAPYNQMLANLLGDDKFLWRR